MQHILETNSVCWKELFYCSCIKSMYDSGNSILKTLYYTEKNNYVLKI